MKRLALFGGSFHPPGLHHAHIAEALAEICDEVVIIPCGPRPDKLSVNSLRPHHRAIMVEKAFARLKGVRLEMFDLENATFTRTYDLDLRFRPEGEVWHVVGGDLVVGGATGASEIQRSWHRGAELWRDGRFIVLSRAGYAPSKGDLPPNHQLLEIDIPGSSSALRKELALGGGDGGVSADVLTFIRRYTLFGPPGPREQSDPELIELRSEQVSSNASTIVSAQSASAPNPNCLLVLGDDKALWNAVAHQWRRRIPFLHRSSDDRPLLSTERVRITLTPFRDLPPTSPARDILSSTELESRIGAVELMTLVTSSQ